ncbi:MAG TPA: hypothetical protein DD414_06065 [Lachnospiraceae bacterium]|nr:hypothetical protein [Lachnospiraceae bacterium]
MGTLGIVLVIGIPATVSDPLFNFFDMLTNNVFLTLGSFFMCIFTGWIWGIDKFAETVGIAENQALTRVLGFVIKYLAPLVVIVFSLSLFGII